MRERVRVRGYIHGRVHGRSEAVENYDPAGSPPAYRLTISRRRDYID